MAACGDLQARSKAVRIEERIEGRIILGVVSTAVVCYGSPEGAKALWLGLFVPARSKNVMCGCEASQ